MPRVRYIDEQSRQGEMDLGRVRVGDLVRFLADFRKLAGPNGALSVRKDEIGEVTALGPEGVRVRAPGLRTAGTDGFSEDVEADVDLHMIAVLIDARDDRVGTERIQDNDLKRAMEEDAGVKDWVAPALMGLGLSGPAEMPPPHDDPPPVQKVTPGVDVRPWNQERLVPMAPKSKTQKVCDEEAGTCTFIPVKAQLEVWELEMLVADVRYAGVDLFDQQNVAAELVRQAAHVYRAGLGPATFGNAAAALVLETAPMAWRAFALVADEQAPMQPLSEEWWTRQNLPPKHEPSPEEVERQTQENEDAGTRAMTPAAVLRDAKWALTAMGPAFAAKHGRQPSMENPSDVAAALELLAADLEGSLPDEVYADAPEYENAMATASRLRDRAEKVRAVGPAEWARELAEIETLKPAERPSSMGLDEMPKQPPEERTPQPRMDLMPDESPESTDDTADPAIRLPIGQPPGYHGRVYADVGMKVYNKATGQQGTVLGGSASTPDGIVVDLEGSGSTAVWDAMSVTVSKDWKGGRQLVPLPAVDAWKKDRAQRLQQEKKQKKESMLGYESCYQVEHGRGSTNQGSSHLARGPARASAGALQPPRGSTGGWGSYRGPPDGGRGATTHAGGATRRHAGAVVVEEPRPGLQYTEVTATDLR